MAKMHVNPNRATDKAVRAIDRKREQERRKMFIFARDHADLLATKLVQRLIDKKIIETTSVEDIRNAFEKQLRSLHLLEEFDLQLKLAPVRTLVQDPNIVTLYLTQFIIEDLVDHGSIQDVFGEDIDIYRAVDSVTKALRPK
ncbi:hypothetical protein [Desulfofustis glycolicus]|uniref:Uncharacterized protein n=1 Tax=Desulfofustis glycolicus DSM 9705 TaxID=1121409 RepID=A0A1M5V9P2_9BACT|nr:hypothetical protein [Desulfofustis glycolicus]MCB2218205.1 hypothetical protein [Desulfobulbaceae bacterium]SHH71946.1 hypothetical protein SAMN02745124_01601 [Desulfofustis glycolicus DSM 9705]